MIKVNHFQEDSSKVGCNYDYEWVKVMFSSQKNILVANGPSPCEG